LPADKLLYLFRNENATLVDLNPLYKDYALQFKAGLRSKGGRLVSSYSPIRQAARPLQDPLYYDLEKLWDQAWPKEGLNGENECDNSTVVAKMNG